MKKMLRSCREGEVRNVSGSQGFYFPSDIQSYGKKMLKPRMIESCQKFQADCLFFAQDERRKWQYFCVFGGLSAMLMGETAGKGLNFRVEIRLRLLLRFSSVCL